ncbi:MAG: type I-C CRISPR-associated protein Cas8c/Csd1 [Verrucomicrobiota bacterium]
MMLQALIAYAERENLGDPDFESTAIHWLLPVSLDGRLAGSPIPLYADPDAKKPQPKRLQRPFTSPNELNQGDKAYFLADCLERALLFNPKDPGKVESRRLAHAYFKKLFSEAATACPSVASQLQAVAACLDSPVELARIHAAMAETKAKPTDNVTFQVAGRNLLDEPELKQFWRLRRSAMRASAKRSQRVCLATGVLAETLDTTEKIRGVPGGLPMGTNLISFDKDSFASYGLAQAQNAAVSPDAELKFRSALNRLIADGLRMSDVVHLHWTREPVSTDVFALLESADAADVRNLLTAPRTRHAPTTLQTNAYYAMSLSGNGGRIVVRDWLEATVPEVEANVRRWFADLTIIDPEGTGRESAFKLGRLLFALVREKIDELPPQIPTQLLYSALRGTQLPQTALAAALRRQQIEAGDQPNPARFGLIKACLLRSSNHSTSNPQPSTTMTECLNPESRDPAYLCGRLFAVFDRLQYLALGSLNAGVAERFYASASVTPALVMGRLFRNAQFHLAKAGGGIAENVRKDFEEITCALGNQFPPALDLEGQGRFALGYYHQKAEYRRRTAERKEQQAAETTA